MPVQASFVLADNKTPKATGTPIDHERVFAVQGDDSDRLSSWRSLIRQEFARKRSIALYVPTIEDSENLFAALEKGIEGYIFRLNGSLTPKRTVENWTKIAETDHPIVVIATGSFSVLPRSDIDTVIIERENSRGWISQKAPYMDARHAIETISRNSKQTVYLADSLLRTETLFRLDKDLIDQGSPFKWRSISTAHDTLVDMRKKTPQHALTPAERAMAERAKEEWDMNATASETETEAGPDAKQFAATTASQSALAPSFRVISNELEALIRTNREESTHLFILTIRRGVAPMTICDDCETIVTCRECGAPVVLHTSTENGKNFFMCHKCGARRSADETCVTCGSWRLTPLGIGIDRVRDEIKRLFPDIDIFKIDAEATKTEKQITEVLEKFKGKPGSIILGTELAMAHIVDKIDHIAVASLDSLFALPDFRIQEKIMYTLIRLRAQATRSILVQTRKPDEKVFEYGLKGNLSDFYRGTLSERKQFAYPPFSQLIKITIEGKKDVIANDMARVCEVLAPHEMDVFPAFTASSRGNSMIHGLMKIEPHAWPDPDTVAKLRTLPPNVSVKVNPESLL